MIRRNLEGHDIIEGDEEKEEKIAIIGKMKRMSSRLRTSGYQSMTTKIIAMVALFAIMVAFSVVIVMRANESVNQPDTEYLWFEVVPDEPGFDVTGDVFIYDDGGELIEHLLLLNETSWQRSEQMYEVRTVVRVYITFWYSEDKVNNVIYLIGRSLVPITLVDVSITFVSDWEEPIF